MPETTEPTPEVPDESKTSSAPTSPVEDDFPTNGELHTDSQPDAGVIATDDPDSIPAESTVTAPPLVEPEPLEAQPVSAAPVSAAPISAEPVSAEPVSATAVMAPIPVAAPVVPPTPPTSAAGHVAVQPVPPREVVYLQAPTPPPARHNRGFGVLISVIGAIVFALLYLAAGAIIISLTPGVNLDSTFRAFALSAAFWIPIAVYTVFAVLFALIADRAAWWAHVIGSLFVATFTYVVSVGVLALMYNVVAMTPEEGLAQIGQIAASPFLIAAAALARECALWFGLAIASRGRRVKERNVAERAKFDSEVAEQRAAYERAQSA